MPIETDAWGLDVVVSGSQKGMSTPPGLSFASVSPAAWERSRETGDAALLLRLEAHARRPERRRQPVHARDRDRQRARRRARPACSTEGLEAIWERTRGARPGASARACSASGLELYSPDDASCSLVTAVARARGRRRRRAAARGARGGLHHRGRPRPDGRQGAALRAPRRDRRGCPQRRASTRCWPRCRDEPAALRRRRADRRDRAGAAARGLRRRRARARRRSARGADGRGRAGRALGHARRRRPDRRRAEAARDRPRRRRRRQRRRGRRHRARASSSATPRRRTSSRPPSTRSRCCSHWRATSAPPSARCATAPGSASASPASSSPTRRSRCSASAASAGWSPRARARSGMRTVAYDPYVTAERIAELGAEQAESIEAALAVADVVSLHLPVTPATRGLIDSAAPGAAAPGRAARQRRARCARRRGGARRGAALGPARGRRAGRLRAGAAAGRLAAARRAQPPAHAAPGGLDGRGAGPRRRRRRRAGRGGARRAPVAHALNLPFVPEDERRVLEPFLPVAERLGRLAMALARGPRHAHRDRDRRTAGQHGLAPAHLGRAARRVRLRRTTASTTSTRSRSPPSWASRWPSSTARARPTTRTCSP